MANSPVRLKLRPFLSTFITRRRSLIEESGALMSVALNHSAASFLVPSDTVSYGRGCPLCRLSLMGLVLEPCFAKSLSARAVYLPATKRSQTKRSRITVRSWAFKICESTGNASEHRISAMAGAFSFRICRQNRRLPVVRVPRTFSSPWVQTVRRVS